MRRAAALACVGMLLGCSPSPSDGDAPVRPRPAEPRDAAEDKRRCVRAHRGDPRYLPVVRTLCAELHDLQAVGATVAIAHADEIVYALAVGPRCVGEPAPLRPDTPMRIGSLSKTVTAAFAIALARREGVDLDAELSAFGSGITLASLMSHRSGIRDLPLFRAAQLDEEGWWSAHEVSTGDVGRFHYANANYFAVGRWIEQRTGRPFVDAYATDPAAAPLRARVRFGEAGLPEAACGHGPWFGHLAVPIAEEPRAPSFMMSAGGGLSSAQDLARLPAALEAMGVLDAMAEPRTASDRPGWSYGYGLRIRDTDGVLAHAGNTHAFTADLQWSPERRIAVAVISNSGQRFAATLLSAFTVAMENAGPAGDRPPASGAGPAVDVPKGHDTSREDGEHGTRRPGRSSQP